MLWEYLTLSEYCKYSGIKDLLFIVWDFCSVKTGKKRFEVCLSFPFGSDIASLLCQLCIWEGGGVIISILLLAIGETLVAPHFFSVLKYPKPYILRIFAIQFITHGKILLILILSFTPFLGLFIWDDVISPCKDRSIVLNFPTTSNYIMLTIFLIMTW